MESFTYKKKSRSHATAGIISGHTTDVRCNGIVICGRKWNLGTVASRQIGKHPSHLDRSVKALGFLTYSYFSIPPYPCLQ
jgi:hypothetical protein